MSGTPQLPPLLVPLLLTDIYVSSPKPVHTLPWRGAAHCALSKGHTCRTRDNMGVVSYIPSVL